MDQQTTPDDVFPVIEMLQGSNEDYTLGLEIIKHFNSYTNLCIASYFIGDKKKRILDECHESFTSNDTNLKSLFRYIETTEDKDLFIMILEKRIYIASDYSEIRQRMKNIIKILNVNA